MWPNSGNSTKKSEEHGWRDTCTRRDHARRVPRETSCAEVPRTLQGSAQNSNTPPARPRETVLCLRLNPVVGFFNHLQEPSPGGEALVPLQGRVRVWGGPARGSPPVRAAAPAQQGASSTHTGSRRAFLLENYRSSQCAISCFIPFYFICLKYRNEPTIGTNNGVLEH